MCKSQVRKNSQQKEVKNSINKLSDNIFFMNMIVLKRETNLSEHDSE
jgi:cob(I)alamin adenosyltransferase